MEVAVGAARWVVGKALGPFSDGLLEAWAASKELGPNVDALKMELLYAQGMLNNTRGREIDNQALNELLQKLRDLAYNAEDVLDELDYFRIQDQLEGTYEAADEHAKGCVCNLFLNAHHTAKAVGKLLWFPACSCATSPGDPREPREEDARQQVPGCAWPCARRRSALDNTSSLPHNNQANEKVSGCMRKLASGARNTIRDVGKRLHCSSLPFVHDDDSSMLKAPQGKHAKETPKLEFDRVDLSRRMKHIVEQLQPVCAKVTAILNLELLGSTRSTAPGIAKSRSSTTSDIVEPKMYGREPAKKDIIDSITHGKYCGEHLTILPIVGPGGIGKTTLVQHIYHSQEVQNHFQVRVWNCVSQNFNVNKLIEEIKESIPGIEGEKKYATVGELIEQRLKSKRFLLILDDIWKCEYEDWKRLLVPLTKGQAKGNIILVTTRFPAVAEMVKTTQSSIDLGGLDREAFRELFLACVFDDQESRNAHRELLETGGKIAEKLKGNPLAAKTVGRLLRNHLDLNHWTRVLESREWEMQTGDHDIMPALKLSYEYLPFHLQQCFSYCALFPEDHEFGSKELIHFWIGLDILRYGGQNKSIEDIGLSNLNELVTHGFFKKDETDGRTCYLIHDLLHDLSLKVASHECVSVARSNVRSVQIRPSVRHLSIIMDDADDNDGITDENFRMELRKLKKRLKVENLQTLMIFGELDESFAGIFCDLFREANALRVLSLPRMSYPVESMLHNFSEFVHLRYLRLMIWNLPSTLSRLYHLRILDLPNLHFYTQDSHDLPRGMSNLVKLRHFLTHDDDVHSAISNVGKVQFLQELRKFQVNKENNGFELKQLGHLMELTELGIYNLEKIHTKEEADEAKLVDKNHLLKLALVWESNVEPDSEAPVLESLRPQNNLQELRIRGHGGPSCPSWLGHKLSVKALKSLHLVGVAWKTLPSLGQMWVLQELTLEGVATLNEFGPSQFGLITEQSFHYLKRLELIGLNGLKKWVVGDACHLFSGLRVLIIRDCPELSELPFMNNICHPPKHDGNIHWLPNLQVFEIKDCPKVLTLPLIPWTPTLCSVMITNGLCRLNYSKLSFEIKLGFQGSDNLRSLDEVVSFNSLTELRELKVWKCPTLESKHLRVLTSLKTLKVGYGSTNVFVPLGSLGDVEWQLPIEHLWIGRWTASGKELTQLLSHLPKLAELSIDFCAKITRMGVEVEQQQRTGPVSWPSSSAVKMEDTQATDQQQQIAEGMEEEEQDEEDGLLLFPAHLSNSLRELQILDCLELILEASPPLLPNGHKAGGIDGVGGLQALCSLQKLRISGCPKLLSAYSSSSSCCPFPSSLQHLDLELEVMETLEPLSNLTSLTRLEIWDCGEDLRGEGLWPLLTWGQLSELQVRDTPKFFAFCSDPTLWGLQDEDQEQQLPKLSLTTDDVAGVLAAPFCSLLSSSLTILAFVYGSEERFTKEQEEALHLLTSLQELTFTRCDKLQCLPAGLHRLTSLKGLQISGCAAIRSLPKDGLPNSLQELDVSDCGNEELKQRCRKLTGTIPKIILD